MPAMVVKRIKAARFRPKIPISAAREDINAPLPYAALQAPSPIAVYDQWLETYAAALFLCRHCATIPTQFPSDESISVYRDSFEHLGECDRLDFDPDQCFKLLSMNFIGRLASSNLPALQRGG
jgi:hypothetical protein